VNTPPWSGEEGHELLGEQKEKKYSLTSEQFLVAKY